MVIVTWAWHKDHGCHALFSEGSATFKHVTKTLTKNQNFSKILFASFHMMQEASERYIKHFSICNIKGAEKFSWSFPVHLFPGVPGMANQHCIVKHLDFCPFWAVAVATLAIV